MNVIMVDESNFKQLIKSRRILAKYFQQISQRTFVGHISQEGLDNLYKEIKNITNRYTSVACFKVVTRSRIELEWIIGNKNNFDTDGTYCFRQENIRKNTISKTADNINKTENPMKNSMLNLTSNKILLNSLLSLAALFHDLGKVNIAFQKKLNNGSGHEPLRHDVMSFLMIEKLFKSLIEKGNLQSDKELFNILKNPMKDNIWDDFIVEEKIQIDISDDDLKSFFVDNNPGNLLCKKLDSWFGGVKNLTLLDKDGQKFNLLKDNFQLTISLLWLILTHHKLIAEQNKPNDGIKMVDKAEFGFFLKKLNGLDEAGFSHRKKQSFNPIENWSKNDVVDNMFINKNLLGKSIFPWQDKTWCKEVNQEIINIDAHINTDLNFNDIAHISLFFLRPALITSDFLGSIDKQDCQSLNNNILANTIRNEELQKNGDTLKQHLKTVSNKSKIVMKILENQHEYFKFADFTDDKQVDKSKSKLFLKELPPKFQWQQKAQSSIDTLKNKNLPFFGVVISETGSGKTLAAPKILTSLSNQQRFTLALGFRNLVLQTGKSYAQDLGLNESLLTTIIGNETTKKLFDVENGIENKNELYGSQSLDLADIESDDFALTEMTSNYSKWHKELLNTLESAKVYSDKMKNIIDYPIVVCTIDYLIRIVEQLHYKDVFSFLRNYSSDLVLDEIDNYSPTDLVSLTKLCFLQGLAGKHLILMSATISQFMFNEFFEAYKNGIEIYNKINSKKQTINTAFISNLDIENICEEVDLSSNDIVVKYEKFVSDFSKKQVETSHKKHVFNILKITQNWKDEIVNEAIKLHNNNAFSVEINGISRKCSIGFVRFNNTDKAVILAKYLWSEKIQIRDNLQIYGQCYHSKMPLIVLNYIEKNLNKNLNRKNDSLNDFIVERFKHITNDVKDLLLIVSTTSIQETGRDHDYDWAILEPTSTRSLVQAAGRIRRHRDENNRVNVLLLSNTIKEIENKKFSWSKPGIEDEGLVLKYTSKFILSDEFKDMVKKSNLSYDFTKQNNDITSEIASLININPYQMNYIYSNLCLTTPNEISVLQNYEYLSHYKALTYYNPEKQPKYANYKYFEKIPYLKFYKAHASSTTFRKQTESQLDVTINPFVLKDEKVIYIDDFKVNCIDPILQIDIYNNLQRNSSNTYKDLFIYENERMIYPISKDVLEVELVSLKNIIDVNNHNKNTPDILDIFFTCKLNKTTLKNYSFNFSTGWFKK